MNRLLHLTAVSLAVLAGFSAAAQDTAATVSLDWSSFHALARNNIFDPTRSGDFQHSSRPRPKVILTFTFLGAVDTDVAFFTGEGVGDRFFRRGDTINGFKIMKIPNNFNTDTDPTVVLTDPSGAIVTLKQFESMRRVDEGPWTKSDDVFTPPAENDASNAPATPVGGHAAGAGMGAVSPLTPANVPFPQVGPNVYSSSGAQLHGAARESEILKQLRLKRQQEDK